MVVTLPNYIKLHCCCRVRHSKYLICPACLNWFDIWLLVVMWFEVGRWEWMVCSELSSADWHLLSSQVTPWGVAAMLCSRSQSLWRAPEYVHCWFGCSHTKVSECSKGTTLSGITGSEFVSQVLMSSFCRVQLVARGSSIPIHSCTLQLSSAVCQIQLNFFIATQFGGHQTMVSE